MRRITRTIPSNKDVVKLASDLRRLLVDLGVDPSSDESLDRLPVDMTDVYVICANYKRLIDELLFLNRGSETSRVLNIIFEIEEHLYSHLPNHYKPLSRGLRKLVGAVEPNRIKRNHAVTEYFDEAMRKARNRSSKGLKSTTKNKREK
jgi:hypothetical protein